MSNVITDTYGYDHFRAEHYLPPFCDDGGPITFQWSFPRGTFEKLMSTRELAEFLLPHMPCILPYFIHVWAYWADPDAKTKLMMQWDCPGCNEKHEVAIKEGGHWWPLPILATM